MEYILENQAHIGNTRLHPSQAALCVGKRTNLWIHDGERSQSTLRRAAHLCQEIQTQGGQILIINKDPQFESLVRTVGSIGGYAYCQGKWTAGFLTNWTQTQHRLKHFFDFENKYKPWLKEHPDPFYLRTKKRFEGLKELTELPQLCIFINPQHTPTALKEAAKMNIPTLAFVNTETSLKNVDYPLFGQNRSIRWVYHAFNTFIQQKTIIS